MIGSTPVDEFPYGDPRQHAARTRSRARHRARRVGGPAAQNRDPHRRTHRTRARTRSGSSSSSRSCCCSSCSGASSIAITSILMNLLTVGAAFGFATLVFQHGFGTGLLGIEHQPFVDAWAPLFFFALLFGLSMDYQLFLLAAIRERYEATGDTKRAIAEGIARTGRPITNAALIMIVVFIAFGITGPIPTHRTRTHTRDWPCSSTRPSSGSCSSPPRWRSSENATGISPAGSNASSRTCTSATDTRTPEPYPCLQSRRAPRPDRTHRARRPAPGELRGRSSACCSPSPGA